MSLEASNTIARLRGLLEVGRLVRSETDLPSLLASIARVVAESLGFRTVVVNLYRPAWDDFEVVVVHGNRKARKALLGRTPGWDFWQPLLDERFARHGAYLIPHGVFDWQAGGHTYVPDVAPSAQPDGWHPEDALLVPLHGADGSLLGILSVDEPVSGRRPSDEELEVLAALAAHGAQAIEAAQEAAGAARHRAALEELMRVSAKLSASDSTDEILQAVCEATRRTLGFRHVVIEVADREADRYRPHTAVGVDLDDVDLQLEVPIARLDRAFDPAVEVEGCFLLTIDKAHARVGGGPSSFQSTMNGRGPHAWNRHWLLVPLRDRVGERMGFIWVDDPEDRLLPSRPRLQALRLFADQAETALAAAAQLEERRALIEASPVGILVVGTDRRVRSWNPAAREMFGYRDEDVIGHEPPWIHEDKEGFRERFDEQLKNGITRAVFTDRRADGTLIEVSTTSAPLRGPEGSVTGMVAVLADITEQEAAKRELARRDAEQRALIEASPLALMSLDSTGIVRAWNRAAERIFGWTAEEAIGRRPALIPDDRREEFEETLRRVLAGESFTGLERERVRRDGSRIRISLSVAPVRAGDGSVTGVMAAIEDVTDRRRDEADLATRNAELEALHETALTLNEKLDHEAVLTAVVRRAAELLGAGGGFVFLEDEAGETLRVAVDHGAFAGAQIEPIRRGEGLSGRVWETGETLSVGESGQPGIHALAVAPLRAGARVVGVLGVGHVDPARSFGPTECALLDRFGQLASLALENARLYAAEREASETSRALVEGAPVAIFSLDREGRVKTWNPAAEAMFGWTAEEAVGRRPPYLDEEGLREADANNARVLAGESVIAAAGTRRRRDGTQIEIVFSGAPVRAPDGSVTGIMSMCVDVTQRRHAERDLARRKAELEALHETTLSLIERLEPAALLRDVVLRAAELLGSEDGWLYLADGDQLVFEVGTGLFVSHEGDRAAPDEGLAGQVFKTGRPLAVDDYRSWAGRMRRFEDVGFVAVAGVPLVSGTEVVGVLGVGHRDEGHVFGEAELELLGRFGRLASLALANARLVEELRQSRELYRRVVDNATDLIALLAPDGKLLYASPSHKSMLGFEAEELVGSSVLETVHPEERIHSARVIADAAAGRSVPYSARVRHADGHWVVLEGICTPIADERGETEMLLSTARDVTERQRMEAARLEAQLSLLREKEYSERLIETANALIMGLDREGRIAVFNAESERVTGYSKAEAIGREFGFLVPPERAEESLRSYARWIEGEGELPDELEYAVVTKSGEERLISWRNRELVVDGRRAGTISFGLDLTEQKRLEEQLRESQKLEAIGRLAGGVAHDFNNLVTAITGYGELALAKLEPESPVRRNIEEMTRAGERAAELTRQLLAFGRRQVLQPKVLDLNDAVSGIEGMLGRLLGDDVTLATALDPELGHTRADPGQIEQVIVNLAINARDAMPRGGRLTIETANVELDEEFAATHVGAVPGGYVLLAVADTGEGMDRATLDRVFEPFFTTKPAGQGTGLGLSTVYGIVKQTGGGIWAYSEQGRGSTFKVYLPRVWEQVEAEPVAPAAPRVRGSETILLVEDEDVVRRLVAEMLESSGYEVLAAADGGEAVRLAAAHGGGIDLLLTDVVMPGLDGPELAARLVAERPELRVLFTSGYTEEAIAGQGVLSPGAAFLEKPFTAADLGRSVRELLDERTAAA